MFILFISVLIFGLVHPVSKLILDQGIPLSYFCGLYVGIRFVFQFPVFFKKNNSRVSSKKIIYLLSLVGLVGAFLQFFEFKGIQIGMQPALVTFIMYSYPTWILIINLFNKRHTFNILEAIQSILTVVGIFFVSHINFSSYDGFSWNLLYPLLASALIAAWIILSNRLRKEGVGSFELSAYYDLFSIFALLIIFNDSLVKDWPQFLFWSHDINHILGLIFYSLMIGLLPNLLFYFSSRNVSSNIAGTMMTFEPFFSALYSTIIWKTTFDSHFVIGGIMIMFANIPKEFFKKAFQCKLAHEG